MAEVSRRQIKCCPGFNRDWFLYLITHRQKTGTSELYFGKREEDGNSLDTESREGNLAKLPETLRSSENGKQGHRRYFGRDRAITDQK